MRSGGKIEGMKKIDTGPLYRHLAGLYLNKIRQTVFSRAPQERRRCVDEKVLTQLEEKPVSASSLRENLLERLGHLRCEAADRGRNLA